MRLFKKIEKTLHGPGYPYNDVFQIQNQYTANIVIKNTLHIINALFSTQPFGLILSIDQKIMRSNEN